MLIVRWFLLALALVSGGAWSDDPIPSGTDKTAPPQQEAKNTNNPSANDQRGTEKRPLFIKTNDSPKASTNATKDEQKGSDKTPFIWGMTAEEATALFTLSLVIVGALTAAVFLCQTILLKYQVETARREFISMQRPKIRFRYVFSNNPIIDQRPTAEIHAANIGGSVAILTDIGVDIFPRIKGTPNSGLFNAVPAKYPNTDPLPPGKEANIQVAGSSILTSESVAGIINGSIELCLLSIINYADSNNIVRSTSSFRIYNPRSLRFVRAAENDEYAEWDYED